MSQIKREESRFRILELYSGIGGFHFAIKRLFQEQCQSYHLTAVDINTSANQVYRQSHLPKHSGDDKDNNNNKIELLERNIQSFSVDYLDSLQLDLLTMSPPCQPFTRLGLKADLEDARSDSYQHILSVLPKLKHKPRFLMLENVAGFESSKAHSLLIEILEQCHYQYLELMLTPTQFSIPNSRLRYYLIARLKCESSSQKIDSRQVESRDILKMVPVIPPRTSIFDIENFEMSKKIVIEDNSEVRNMESNFKISEFLEISDDDDEVEKLYQLDDSTLQRYHMIFDLVTQESSSSNCFTKAYGHRIEGTGSILKTAQEVSIDEVYQNVQKLEKPEEIVSELRRLKLRFFTPREIANLMCMPSQLEFPESFNVKQKNRLLGNSVNVLVCYYLLRILLGSISGDEH